MPHNVKKSKKIIKGMLIIYDYQTKYFQLWQIKKKHLFTHKQDCLKPQALPIAEKGSQISDKAY